MITIDDFLDVTKNNPYFLDNKTFALSREIDEINFIIIYNNDKNIKKNKCIIIEDENKGEKYRIEYNDKFEIALEIFKVINQENIIISDDSTLNNVFVLFNKLSNHVSKERKTYFEKIEIAKQSKLDIDIKLIEDLLSFIQPTITKENSVHILSNIDSVIKKPFAYTNDSYFLIDNSIEEFNALVFENKLIDLLSEKNSLFIIDWNEPLNEIINDLSEVYFKLTNKDLNLFDFGNKTSFNSMLLLIINEIYKFGYETILFNDGSDTSCITFISKNNKSKVRNIFKKLKIKIKFIKQHST